MGHTRLPVTVSVSSTSMKAPSSSSASQSAANDTVRSGGGGSTSSQLPPLVRIALVLFALIMTSAVVLLQSPRPDPFTRPRALLSLNWWRYPLEWNAPSRLPKVECSLRAIQALPNTTYVWAAGNKGMVVVSADSGLTWTKRGIEQSQVRNAAAPALPTPTAAPAVSSPSKAFLNLPDLIPAAEAAELSDDQKPGSQSTQQGPPKPTPTPFVSSAVQGPLRSSATPTPAARPRPSANNSQIRIPPRSQASALPSSTTSGPPGTPTPTPSATPDDTQRSVEAESLIAIYFADQNRGEAVSQIGNLFKTNDGGGKWDRDFVGSAPIRTIPSYPTDDFVSFQMLSPNTDDLSYVAINSKGTSYQLFYLFFPDAAKNTIFSLNSPTSKNIAILNPSVFFRLHIPAYAAHFLLDSKTGWIVGAKGQIWRTIDGGKSGDSFQAGTGDDLHAVYFTDTNRGWVAGSNGAIFTTNNGGTSWQPQTSGTPSQLNAINFLPDGQHGWIAGEDGLILSTDDGGATWEHRTQGKEASGRYLRFPAPWYFVALLIMGLMLYRRTEETAAPPEESVADVLVSDRPLDSPTGDVLSFNAIALGLSQFLRNENTLPPLTIAVIGEWGTGKSSLMNLLRADLRSYKFRPVWFNAWHHQKEEHMLASLLENVKLQAVPRWWTTRGLIFRARLLKIRGWRHWAPLLLLVFFIYVLLLYHYGQHGTDDDFSGLFKFLSGSGEAGASHLLTLVPLLAGVVTFVGAIWRGITAFGVKPASLLAGVSSGVSIRGLEAQTSFRQKFAVEFSDATRALGQRSLLIFIDDLDRCRPENVLETLEAVNFLTTSGDCFVVIGMAREYVERCVGRAFKDIAEEMIDDAGQKAVPGEPEDEAKETRAKQKRIEFARQYLDKLVNIEVPVPTAKPDQSLKLLLSGADEMQELEELKNQRSFKAQATRLIVRYWKVLPALVMFAGLLVGGSYLADNLRWNTQPEPSPTPVVSPTPLATPTTLPTPTPANATERSTPVPTPLATPSAVPTPDQSNQRAQITPGGRALFSRNVVSVLGLVALIWIGVTMLTRRPGLIVKDSPRFVDALTIWHSLIFSRQSTPRSTKRFMNHVRYLAMRQRQPTDSSSLLRRIFFPRHPTRPDNLESQNPDPSSAKQEDTKSIPDEALVALVALEHFKSSILGEDYSPLWPLFGNLESAERQLLNEAVAAHKAKFGAFDVLQYRQRFLEMSAGVEVR
jgi:photosystem II stability/assembly factor-like uncharacterized protein